MQSLEYTNVHYKTAQTVETVSMVIQSHRVNNLSIFRDVRTDDA